jgi:hypothetical protein
MNKHVCSILLIISLVTAAFSQTGPNNPGPGNNNTSIGTNAWSNTSSIINSNNNSANVSAKGISNYLEATNFGFSIGSPSAIDGIQVDFEKSTTSATAVAVLNNWTTGNTKTISSGVSRCLIAVVVLENGNGPRDVTALTYGGQSMTQIAEEFVGTTGAFTGKIEYWRLMETGIAAASNTSFVATYTAAGLTENWEALSSAVFQYVDQVTPVSDFETFTSNNSTNPITLGSAMTTVAGGIAISTVFCGNITTPTVAVGGTNTYSINSSFTEVIDTYTANSGFTTSGGAFQIAHKLTTTAATEAPTYTFAGTPNRQVAVTINLQSLRELDHSVRIMKGGTITGNNLAQTTTAWLPNDSYVSYGNSTQLWGTTWTTADVNATNFGVVMSVSVANGIAQVDHVQITIYSHSTLPVELMFFSGESNNGMNHLYWQTATENNNKQFVIERSGDMIEYTTIAVIPGHGNSYVINKYEFTDNDPLYGNNYYRLKQVDFDGEFEYSKNIVLSHLPVSDALIVYPNPSPDGIFMVSSPAPCEEEVLIYSSDLKLAKKIALEESKIALSELADGIYYMIFTVNGEQKIRLIEKSSRMR